MKPHHYIEAAICLAAFTCFRLLPLDAASRAGATLGTLAGRLLSRQSRVARINLALAFPEKPAAEREAILRAMWQHLGRNFAEFAHFKGNALIRRITFKGLENIPQTPALFVSGHYGQWELGYASAHEHGVPVTLIYRKSNNDAVDNLINATRLHHAAGMLPKGPKGAAKLAGALKRGESLALLFDQKMNEGLPVPFFGKAAMTAPAIAHFARRFNLPIIPARVVRTTGCHFTATVYPALPLEADDAATLTKLNALLESWIREHPEQWLWIHRRWPKEEYA